MRRATLGAMSCGLALLAGLSSCSSSHSTSSSEQGIHKIKHVVVIMQENRSFDSYFGTYPAADGIPMQNGQPTVCSPDPATGGCIKPVHDPNDVNGGGPHGAVAATADIHNGKMDGFVAEQHKGILNRGAGADPCKANPQNPLCSNSASIDVMGWHDAREIPNYWTYAQNFVLQDHMFEPNASWSLPQHLYMVSEWSAKCATKGDPMSCANALDAPDQVHVGDRYRPVLPTDAEGDPIAPVKGPDYAWTDLTFLLHKKKVSWGYYVVTGTEPDCRNDAAVSCARPIQNARTPSIWNPLPYFDTVRADKQLGNIKSIDTFYAEAKSGALPAVSWVTPSGQVSEHPPASISAGQAYVTSLVNALMNGPDWKSTAIFLAWDDWGGLYDHVVPPKVDENGFGLRVPGLVISPYAKKGFIDHQTMSFDAYTKFIEDDFLVGQRLDPANDGRPDPRPEVRENKPQIGDVTKDFDFTQAPRPPMTLPVHPPPGPPSQ